MIAERVLMALLLGGIAIGCVRRAAAVLLGPALGRHPGVHHLAGLRVAAPAPASAAVASPPGLMVVLTAVAVVLPLALAAPGGADDVDHLRAIDRGRAARRPARLAGLGLRHPAARADARRALEPLGRRHLGDGGGVPAVFRHVAGRRPQPAARHRQRRAAVPAGAVRGVLLLRVRRADRGAAERCSCTASPARGPTG